MASVEGKQSKAKHDNFYTPKNDRFYAQFHYSPLNELKKCIRLLRVHRADARDDKTSPIRCDLLDNVALHDMKGKYITLSYCAGDPRKNEIISINGLDFNAFANLGHAIRQARHLWANKFPDEELLLWTDQVVINQSDPAERAHQVSFMGDIYANSAQVLVSLSSEGNPSGGLAWLNALNTLVEEDIEEQIMSGRSFVMRGIRELVDHVWQHQDFHDRWHAFVSICISSPYWSRAWVRQEFIRPPEAVFMASFEYLDRHEFTKGFALHNNLQPHWIEHNSRLQTSTELSRDNDEFQDHVMLETHNNRVLYLLNAKQTSDIHTGAPGDLLDQLAYSHVCEATDPRDLIFALLGISNHSYGLRPDYSPHVSIIDVLCRLTRNIIEHNCILEILDCAYARAPKPANVSERIPSWIPAMHYEGGIRPSALLKKQKQGALGVNILVADGGGYNHILKLKGVRCDTFPREPGTSSPLQGNDAALASSLDGFDDKKSTMQQEIWLLSGGTRPFVFEKQGENHKLISQLVDGHGLSLAYTYEQLAQMEECGSPDIEIISIC